MAKRTFLADKMVFYKPSVIDDLLTVETSDGSVYVQSDITLMKNVNVDENVSPVIADELRARATIRPTTTVDGVSDADMIENIKPRSIQTLNEIDAYNRYNKETVTSKVETDAKEEEYKKLRESIINPESTE